MAREGTQRAFLLLEQGIGKMAKSPESLKNLVAGNKRGPAKVTMALKEAILKAAAAAGGEGGTVAYLTRQAHESPAAFLGLLGKILPTIGPGENGEHLLRVTSDAAFAEFASVLDSVAPGATSRPH